MKIKKMLLAVFLPLMVSNSANAALALDATRYIYNGNTSFLSAIANNESDEMYGGQVWIDNITENDTRPTFVTTPSFFKINGKGRQVFRIMKMSDHMPKDKESIYWLNLQEIPPANKGNGLSMAIRTRVKLIYRPEAIVEGRSGAEQYMTIQHLPGQQWLVNSTPYIFAISDVFDNENKPLIFNDMEKVNLTMFMPGDKVNITGQIVMSVNALNDYGSLEKYVLKNVVN
ncbi:fimbria/pilus periplasmic chaperone [Photobacterium leiognathi]|uniref:fimbria/pilus periplasmic chaperone n=1 Tax=Photobacterium leiognathi TaxID=553611 RepID=UPI0029819EF4|nr:fimbria/pilus periplasmic chaperone [Photobacterium leiognathi]